MNNPAYCPLLPRVAAVTVALRGLEEHTGHRGIYCPHVTGRPDEMLAAARAAVQAGATGLMGNVFAPGPASLQMPREAGEPPGPTRRHPAGPPAPPPAVEHGHLSAGSA